MIYREEGVQALWKGCTPFATHLALKVRFPVLATTPPPPLATAQVDGLHFITRWLGTCRHIRPGSDRDSSRYSNKQPANKQPRSGNGSSQGIISSTVIERHCSSKGAPVPSGAHRPAILTQVHEAVRFPSPQTATQTIVQVAVWTAKGRSLRLKGGRH